MTRTLRRRLAAAVLSAATAVALAACAPTHAGTAATVADTRITTGALGDRIERSLRDPTAQQRLGTDRAAFSRRILSVLINHEIVTAAATEQGVSITDGEVDARLRAFADQAGGMAALESQAAANGVARTDLRSYVRDIVLTERIGDKLLASTAVPAAELQAAYQQNYVRVHAAHILVKDKATADRLLAQAKADPKQFPALARRFSTDPESKVNGGDLGTAPPSQYVAPFAKAVSTMPIGSFTTVQSEFGWHVIHLITRQALKPLAEATPEIRRQVLQEQQQEKIGALFSSVANRLKVRVNPRFGVWNAKTGQVDPPKDELSTPVRVDENT